MKFGSWPHLELHPHPPIRAGQEWKLSIQHKLRHKLMDTRRWKHNTGEEETTGWSFGAFYLISRNVFFTLRCQYRELLFSAGGGVAVAARTKSHTSRLDNKTGALTEGGCCRCVDFRPRNERTEGDDFENHPEHDASRTALLPITAATQWWSVQTFIR